MNFFIRDCVRFDMACIDFTALGAANLFGIFFGRMCAQNEESE